MIKSIGDLKTKLMKKDSQRVEKSVSISIYRYIDHFFLSVS